VVGSVVGVFGLCGVLRPVWREVPRILSVKRRATLLVEGLQVAIGFQFGFGSKWESGSL